MDRCAVRSDERFARQAESAFSFLGSVSREPKKEKAHDPPVRIIVRPCRSDC
jgi:hypothetical protein